MWHIYIYLKNKCFIFIHTTKFLKDKKIYILSYFSGIPTLRVDAIALTPDMSDTVLENNLPHKDPFDLIVKKGKLWRSVVFVEKISGDD